MASDSYPRPDFNGGEVTELLYERLASVQAPDGLVGVPSGPALAYADGLGTRQVKIRANRRALLRGFMYDSGSTDVGLTLAANSSGSTRIDLIVLRLTRSTWRVQEAVITGVAGAGVPPSPLSQVDTGVWDLPVAAVTVANGAGALGAGTVKPLAWYLGSDGQILCTADTRPPHELGRAVWDTAMGYLVSTGAVWLVGVEGAGTTTLTMSSGFVADINHVHRRNGSAFADLSFRRSAAGMNGGSGYSVARLPAGYRPPFTYQTIAQCPSAQVVLTVAVRDDGFIIVNPGVDMPANRTVVLSALNHPVA